MIVSLRTDLLKMSAFRLETTVGPDLMGCRPFSSFRKENSLLCRWRSWSNLSQRSWSKAVRHRGARTMCSLISKGANFPQEPARVWRGTERRWQTAQQRAGAYTACCFSGSCRLAVRGGRPKATGCVMPFTRVSGKGSTTGPEIAPVGVKDWGWEEGPDCKGAV